MLGLDLGGGVPLLQLARPAGRAYAATFTVCGGERFAAGLTTGPGRTGRHRQLHGLVGLRSGEATSLAGAAAVQPPPTGASPGGSPTASYAWDFGDGTTLTTSEPWADHDYERALGAEEEHRSFDVAVEYADAAGAITRMVRTRV